MTNRAPDYTQLQLQTVILSGAKNPRAERSAASCRIPLHVQDFAIRATASPGGSSHTLGKTEFLVLSTIATVQYSMQRDRGAA